MAERNEQAGISAGKTVTPSERERAEPTIADTERVIHKIMACRAESESMIGPLILMKHFAQRCAEAARHEERKRCAGIADEWANSKSCIVHDNDPCCHVRTGAGIAAKIRGGNHET